MPSSEEEDTEENFVSPKRKHKKRKKNSQQNTYSQSQIQDIIGFSSGCENNPQKTWNSASSNIPSVNKKPSTQNRSKFNSVSERSYQNYFYLQTDKNINRVHLANIWAVKNPSTQDVIIQTKLGFCLKSNQEKAIILETLKELKNEKIIIDFQETKEKQNSKSSTSIKTMSYSAVVLWVDKEIQEEEFSTFLQTQIKLSFCKRIIAKATNKPCSHFRIMTQCLKSYETLLNNGVYYKCKHFVVHPSIAPNPLPIPCAKCAEFTHKSEACPNNLICSKCRGNHKEAQCQSTLAPSCQACGSFSHSVWSIKCPKGPMKPIEGIPNIKIKSINKKSYEIKNQQLKQSRIHGPVTIHDMIIENYMSEVNNPNNKDRQDLIVKLKNKFIEMYRIDTHAVFSGNKMYILMFDTLQENAATPTEPKEGQQTQVENSNGY